MQTSGEVNCDEYVSMKQTLRKVYVEEGIVRGFFKGKVFKNDLYSINLLYFSPIKRCLNELGKRSYSDRYLVCFL